MQISSSANTLGQAKPLSVCAESHRGCSHWQTSYWGPPTKKNDLNNLHRGWQNQLLIDWFLTRAFYPVYQLKGTMDKSNSTIFSAGFWILQKNFTNMCYIPGKELELELQVNIQDQSILMNLVPLSSWARGAPMVEVAISESALRCSLMASNSPLET